LARLNGVELQSQWDVLKALENQNFTRMEAIDRMQEVCLEAIRAYPWQFLDTRVRHFVWFWITPNGTRRPLTLELHAHEDGPTPAKAFGSAFPPPDYCGQAHWRWDGYYRDGKLNWLWHPSAWLYLLTTVWAGLSVTVLFFDRPHRAAAVAIGLLLLFVSSLTVLGGRPEYRFRMVLEPIMLVSIAQLAMKLTPWLAARFSRGREDEQSAVGARLS
jgi:hypothetical protein